MSDPTVELLRHARALRNADLPFMIVGALAVAVHGSPRASSDLDFVVHLPLTRKGDVERVLRDMGYADVEERRDEFGFRLVVHPSPALSVEVFLTPPVRPYDEEFRRRTHVTFAGEVLPFISPEDLRIRRGQDYDDVVSVLAVQGARFDHAYVRARCALYRVCERFDQAIKDAEAAQATD